MMPARLVSRLGHMTLRPGGSAQLGAELRCESRMGHSRTPVESVGQVLRGLGALTWATRYARTRGGQNADFMRREMENRQVSGHSDGSGWAGCKTVGSAYVGSNPTPATSQNPRSARCCLLTPRAAHAARCRETRS